jgi:penicillin-binding protein 1B
MALLLEWRYEKQEILSAYINEVYLGQGGTRAIHGFGTAAEFYFNKPLTELRRDQLALLVGLVRGASFYNPRRSPDRAEARRNLVLKLMVEQGYLDEQTRILLDKNSLGVSKTGGTPDSGFQSFLDLARRQLLRDYELDDLKNEGLKIYTTLDTLQQQGLNDIVERRLNSLEKQHDLKAGSLEAATVIINPVNGEVLALSGGRNSTHSGFNRALDAYRPIGSLIKPFIYLTALSSGKYSLLSDLLDRRVSLDQKDGLPWTPDNYDKFEHGEISLLEAIVHSYNLATVRLGLEVGLDNIITTLHKAGVNGAINPYPSLLLGAQELSPFEVTQIYQTLANGGYRAPLNSIREVLDNQGEPLQHRSLTIDKTLEEGPVFLVNYVLKKVVEMGTARHLSNYLGPDSGLAGKTGTTNESRDSWYAGFSDDILAVTWLGRDDNEPTPFTGASGAMLIWADVLKSASYIPLNLVTPQDIAWTDDMGLYFGDECVQLGPVPYIGTIAPESALDCSRKQLIFDIRSWFQ